MKKWIFVCLLACLPMFLLTAQNSGVKALAGKTITAKTSDGSTRTFTFSADGMKATLDQEYTHTFVKEVNGVYIFEGTYKKNKHYDAFKIIDKKTVLVAAPSSQGSISKTYTNFTDPDKVAANIDKLGIKYTFK